MTIRIITSFIRFVFFCILFSPTFCELRQDRQPIESLFNWIDENTRLQSSFRTRLNVTLSGKPDSRFLFARFQLLIRILLLKHSGFQILLIIRNPRFNYFYFLFDPNAAIIFTGDTDANFHLKGAGFFTVV